MEQLLLGLAPPLEPTFTDFFMGRNVAGVAAVRSALAGGERFVYLWGDSGSGKTHLLRAAIGESGKLHRRKAFYGHPHSIECDLPKSSGNPAGPAESGNPDIPVFAVDDCNLLDIIGQLALFDLYNELRAGPGVLLTAGNRPPADLPLREDLRTRLGAGLVMQLHPLTDVEKALVLHDHAARKGLELPEDVLAYVMNRVGRDLGTQVAMLDFLDRISMSRKRAVTLPLAREALRQFEN